MGWRAIFHRTVVYFGYVTVTRRPSSASSPCGGLATRPIAFTRYHCATPLHVHASLRPSSLINIKKKLHTRIYIVCLTGSPCEHDGVCVNTPGSFACNCPQGFTGPRCETNVNECDSHPCKNEGSCLDDPGTFRCVCMPGKFTSYICLQRRKVFGARRAPAASFFLPRFIFVVLRSVTVVYIYVYQICNAQ